MTIISMAVDYTHPRTTQLYGVLSYAECLNGRRSRGAGDEIAVVTLKQTNPQSLKNNAQNSPKYAI